MNAQFTDPASSSSARFGPTCCARAGRPTGQHDMYDGMETFAAGQAGMYRTATSSPRLRGPKKSKVAGKVGYAMLPPGPAGTT